MDLTTESSAPISRQASSGPESTPSEVAVPTSPKLPLGQEAPVAENPASPSRANLFLSKLYKAMEGIFPVKRKTSTAAKEKEDTHPLASLARRDSAKSTDEKDTLPLALEDYISISSGKATERLVPLLDCGLIDSWDEKTGAIVLFKNGKEGFKLLPKGVAGLKDDEFLATVKAMLPTEMCEAVKDVRKVNNFVSAAPKRSCSYRA
ncbi:hypothetical protein GGI20_001344 [Coemansia sp. BCRC 34301]|nr:hypothetical protein GGI20_001344 [Coemansia sp. BCRC 34301]